VDAVEIGAVKKISPFQLIAAQRSKGPETGDYPVSGPLYRYCGKKLFIAGTGFFPLADSDQSVVFW
jgi:hypothetical protein